MISSLKSEIIAVSRAGVVVADEIINSSQSIQDINRDLGCLDNERGIAAKLLSGEVARLEVILSACKSARYILVGDLEDILKKYDVIPLTPKLPQDDNEL